MNQPKEALKGIAEFELRSVDQTWYLTRSQCTGTGPTIPSADPVSLMPGTVATRVPMFKSLV